MSGPSAAAAAAAGAVSAAASSVSAVAAAAVIRLPKRKYALLFGYSGQGYMGLQVQPTNENVRTIEGEIINALGKVGVITPDIMEQVQRCSWSRAARTDKGVHALGQVVALKMRLAEADQPTSTTTLETPLLNEKKATDAARKAQAEADFLYDENARRKLVAQLNELLPKQIRIFECLRVTNGFEAKKACSSRYYEYLLPTYVLSKNQRMWDIVDEVKKKYEVKAAADAVAAAAAAAVQTDGAEKEVIVPDLASAEGIGNSREFADSVRARIKEVLGENESRPVTKEEHGNDTPEELAAWLAARREQMQNYKITADEKRRLNDALAMFVGTHRYHNYTSQLRPSDDACKRYILSFEAQGPEVVRGVEMMRLVVQGQSFVLNQIRKMVGMAVEVTRRGLSPEEIINQSFERRGMVVPMAPAAGLLLHSTAYNIYNTTLNSGRMHGTTARPLSFQTEALTAKQRLLASEVVYPAMVQEDNEHSRFMEHISACDIEVFPRLRAVNAEWATTNSKLTLDKRQYRKEGYLLGKRRRNYKGAERDASEANLEKLARVEHELREVDDFVFRDQIAESAAPTAASAVGADVAEKVGGPSNTN